ncbi:MAG: hypothetical protein COA45_09105 [Zetaproteobacteria bacterium]|nr:MAG: hypothetical protein COA45_09105 [Zetaproteobacteria bacterium]
MFGLLLPKGLFSYSVMPQIVPRMRDLFMSGFHYIPFFIAVVYQMVGLLPRSHPYLNQRNIGLYGIRHVVCEAARNVKFSLKNIDQILMFVAVIVGLIIFFVQFLSLIMLLFLQPAMAMPTTWIGFFSVDNVSGYRSHDLAFMMLDMVFGVPHPSIATMGFFESCVGSAVNCVDNFGVNVAATNTAGTGVSATIAGQFGPLTPTAYTYFPFPYHLGMHSLFSVYSTGLLVIAVIITSYFIVTILAETAQTGTPFGKRFNKTWAPLRIVIAFGLLMPLGSGLNSSQYVVLYAAKIGSAFASNGWRLFDSTLTQSLGGGGAMISTPNAPDVSSLLQFLYVAKVCKYINDYYERDRFETETAAWTASLPAVIPAQTVEAYAVFQHSASPNFLLLDTSQDYDSMLSDLDDAASSVIIRFGIRNEGKYKDSHSFVSPICGEITLTMEDARDPPLFGGDAEPGADWMQYTYYQLWWHIWHDTDFIDVAGGPGTAPPTSLTAGLGGSRINRRDIEVAHRMVKGAAGAAIPTSLVANNQAPVDSIYVNNVKANVKNHIEIGISLAVSDQSISDRLTTVDPNLNTLHSRGWAGAGIWYNRVAEMNGMVIGATYAIPIVSKYPAIMEKVVEEKSKYNKDIDAATQRKPDAAGINSLATLLGGNKKMEEATALYTAEFEWSSGGLTQEDLTGNAFLDAISALLGVNGLYDLRNNVGTHPLAMLVGVGRALVESAVRSLGYAALGATLGAAEIGGAVGKVSANFFISVAMMGLTVGFVLFYVVPFLPFIYFFFAVGGWLKGIFEAMVGAPLWALAHIRIDGHGMPGNAAINGYFLIFEVFLRPILTVFGLLASISIFSALVDVLNSVFSIVTENVGGYDMNTELASTAATSTSQYVRSRIDEFFFTVIYAIIVYLIAMSSFKLIDTIPNNILRWMGQSVATFGDQREDPAQGLVSKTTVGSQQALSKIGGGLHAVVKGVG